MCNIKSGKIKLSFKLGAWLAYVIYDIKGLFDSYVPLVLIRVVYQ